jgi:dolichyl-phosphate-mannose--protein O-mannosyl transferase
MLDVFFFAFVVWGILAFTAALRPDAALMGRSSGGFTFQQRRGLIVLSGICFGLGAACKWNAVVTLAAVALVAAVLFVFDLWNIRELGLPILLAALILVPPLTYVLAYLLLAQKLHRALSLQELIQLQIYMWRFHALCPGNPSLNAPWYAWLFRRDPVRALRYLMGNFVVVWGGLLALLICAMRFLRHRFNAIPEAMVVLFYAVNLLQWAVIPQKMSYYYYYYPAAMFLAVAIAIVLRRADNPSVLGLRVSLMLVVTSAIFFLYCYPRMMDLEAPFDCALSCWS